MAYAPQLALLVQSVAAPIWATVAYHQGWINYTAKGWGSMAFWMNGLWALWNCYFAYYVVRHSLTMRQRRDDHRFDEQTAIEVLIQSATGSELIPAMTADLNSAGIGFRATRRVEPGTKVSIVLPLGAERVRVGGEIRHVEVEQSGLGDVYVHGVVFGDLPMEARDAIEMYCTNHSMPVWRMRYRQSIDIVRLAGETMHNLRAGRRTLVGLPASVSAAGGEGDDRAEVTRTFVLEEIGPRGARLIGDAPIEPGTPINFSVFGSSLAGSGTVRHVEMHQTSMAVLFTIGVELTGAPRRMHRWLPATRPLPLPIRAESDQPEARAS